MDLDRLYRAKIAARMQATEYRRQRFLEGKIKPTDLDKEEWALILQMDELVEDG